jgi:NADH:ubiquinone oxidoreductase subunit D
MRTLSSSCPGVLGYSRNSGQRYFSVFFSIKSMKNYPVSRRIKGVTLNFGPNHPAAHGILKLVVQLQGEVMQRMDPQFGFLHRGTEKLIEHRTYLQALPYFDRLDYVANLFQEHAHCLAVEELSLLRSSTGLDYCVAQARTMFDELSRLLNHLLTMSATCLDLGSMGPIFWAFEERERLMEFYERMSGARMHTALYKPGNFDLTPMTHDFFLDLSKFLTRAGRSISGAVMGLINNKVLKTRLGSVGMLSLNKIMNYGITGIVARSGGLRKDLRLQRNARYGAYWGCSFRTFLGRRGDNLDRFLMRVKESFEVFRITSQLITYFSMFIFPSTSTRGASTSLGSTNSVIPGVSSASEAVTSGDAGLQFVRFFNKLGSTSKFTGMEELISHFKYYSGGASCERGVAYCGVEGPKGEIGTTIVASGYSKAYRTKIRTPVSHNMHLLPSVCAGFVFGDFVMTFCSMDIVLGEIDR